MPVPSVTRGKPSANHTGAETNLSTNLIKEEKKNIPYNNPAQPFNWTPILIVNSLFKL